MPEVSDEELAKLRADAEAAARHEAALAEATKGKAAAEQQARAWAERYNTDLSQAAQLLQQSQQPKTTAVEEDEDGIVSRRDLKRVLEESRNANEERSTQAEIVWARNQRQTNRQIFASARDDKGKPRYRHFDRYAAEVDALLDKIDPRAAAHPDAYPQVYATVLGHHYDEVRKLDDEARKAEEAAERDDDDDYVDDERGDEPRVERSASPAPARREPAAPLGDARQASGGRAISVRRGRERVHVDDSDRFAADRYFGGNVDAYLKSKDQGEDRDFLGSKGRSRF